MALSRNVWCWVLKIFDDDDYDWASRGQSHMGRRRPGPLCQSLSHRVHGVETRGSVGEDDTLPIRPSWSSWLGPEES